MLLRNMRYRLGTANDFLCGSKPVFFRSQPHTYSTLIGEEKYEKRLLSTQATYNMNKMKEK